jgi:hypothetical protein
MRRSTAVQAVGMSGVTGRVRCLKAPQADCRAGVRRNIQRRPTRRVRLSASGVKGVPSTPYEPDTNDQQAHREP